MIRQESKLYGPHTCNAPDYALGLHRFPAQTFQITPFLFSVCDIQSTIVIGGGAYRAEFTFPTLRFSNAARRKRPHGCTRRKNSARFERSLGSRKFDHLTLSKAPNKIIHPSTTSVLTITQFEFGVGGKKTEQAPQR